MACRKNRRQLPLLRGYALLLNGSSDAQILDSGISHVELEKIKSIHTRISQNTHYMVISTELSVDHRIVLKIMYMYNEHREGKQLSFLRKPPHITHAFRLMLENKLNDVELLEAGCTEIEIELAKRFLYIAPHAETMLLATIGQQFGVGREPVARMLKIYREQQQAEMMTMEEDS